MSCKNEKIKCLFCNTKLKPSYIGCKDCSNCCNYFISYGFGDLSHFIKTPKLLLTINNDIGSIVQDCGINLSKPLKFKLKVTDLLGLSPEQIELKIKKYIALI